MVKGKYFVTDAHCHVYPEKIASKAVGGTDKFYGVVSYCTGTFDNLILEGKNKTSHNTNKVRTMQWINLRHA